MPTKKLTRKLTTTARGTARKPNLAAKELEAVLRSVIKGRASNAKLEANGNPHWKGMKVMRLSDNVIRVTRAKTPVGKDAIEFSFGNDGFNYMVHDNAGNVTKKAIGYSQIYETREHGKEALRVPDYARSIVKYEIADYIFESLDSFAFEDRYRPAQVSPAAIVASITKPVSMPKKPWWRFW